MPSLLDYVMGGVKMAAGSKVGDHPGIHGVLTCGRGRQRGDRTDALWEGAGPLWPASTSKTAEEALGQRGAGGRPLGAGGGQAADSLREALGRDAPCWRLDCSPARLNTERKTVTFCGCQPLGLWSFVTAADGSQRGGRVRSPHSWGGGQRCMVYCRNDGLPSATSVHSS